MHEHEESDRPVEERRGGERGVGGVAVRSGRPAGRAGVAARGGRSGWAGSRRRTRGPRPVRPAVAPVTVRPAQMDRPACRAVPSRPGQRLLIRPAAASGPRLALRFRVRRAVAGAVLVVAAAAVVVGLGLLADVVVEARGASPGGPAAEGPVVTVTVSAEHSVWDVARVVVPEASSAELAVVAERIVTANSLTSVSVHPGQVLRVTTG